MTRDVQDESTIIVAITIVLIPAEEAFVCVQESATNMPPPPLQMVCVCVGRGAVH